MISRSGFSRARRYVPAAFGAACLALCGLGGCNNPTGLELTPEAIASCPGEEATPDQTAAGPTMLPGRVCGACHRSGGQAQNSPWTLAGTIYPDGAAKCNSAGLAGATIQVLYTADDPMGRYRKNDVQPGGNIKSNEAGNFYSTGFFVTPIRIRVFTGTSDLPTKEMFMTTLVGLDPVTNQSVRVDCNTCHGGTATPRVYL